MHLHAAIPLSWCNAWFAIPYITNEAMIPNPAFADCQNNARAECSSVLYHVDTIC